MCAKDVDVATTRMYGEVNIKSDSAMSTATEPARPRCFPPGDVMHESA